MKIMAIDPGSVQSAVVLSGKVYSGEVHPQSCETFICQNECVLGMIGKYLDVVLIEKIASYGMAVGKDIFETVFWSGRFAQVAEENRVKVERIERRVVKMHLCKSAKASDANIIATIADKFDPMRKYGKYGKGTMKNRGPFFGFSKDVWQAYALLLTFVEGGAE